MNTAHHLSLNAFHWHADARYILSMSSPRSVFDPQQTAAALHRFRVFALVLNRHIELIVWVVCMVFFLSRLYMSDCLCVYLCVCVCWCAAFYFVNFAQLFSLFVYLFSFSLVCLFLFEFRVLLLFFSLAERQSASSSSHPQSHTDWMLNAYIDNRKFLSFSVCTVHLMRVFYPFPSPSLLSFVIPPTLFCVAVSFSRIHFNPLRITLCRRLSSAKTKNRTDFVFSN